MVGIATLFSHSLRVEIKKEAKAGQPQEQQQTVIISPSDAVTSNSFTFETDTLIEISPVFESVEKIKETVPVVQRTVSYFHTLFRFIISPNAP